MICDALFDMYGEDVPFETYPIVQEELDRIDKDFLLANTMLKPQYAEIINKRTEYQQLTILPLNENDRKTREQK